MYTLTQSDWETIAGIGTIVIIFGVLGEAVDLYSNLIKDKGLRERLNKIFWMVVLAGLALEYYGTQRARLMADASNALLQHQSKLQADRISEQQDRISTQQDLIAIQQKKIEIQQGNITALQFNTDALLGLPATEIMSETDTSRVYLCSAYQRPERNGGTWIWQQAIDDAAEMKAVHRIFFKLGQTPVKRSVRGIYESTRPSPSILMTVPSSILGGLLGFGTSSEAIPLVGLETTQNVAYAVFTGWSLGPSRRYFISYLIDPHDTNTIKTISVKGTNVFLDGKLFN